MQFGVFTLFDFFPDRQNEVTYYQDTLDLMISALCMKTITKPSLKHGKSLVATRGWPCILSRQHWWQICPPAALQERVGKALIDSADLAGPCLGGPRITLVSSRRV